ncbi:MAG: hypothetical protein WKG32_12500 [Gemmatimonadaceae bacterium]
MLAHKITVIAITIGGLAACASSSREVSSGEVAAAADAATTTPATTATTPVSWSATLAPPSGAAMAMHDSTMRDSTKKDSTMGAMKMPTVTGSASVAPGTNGTETKATVRISGGTPGSSYPWHVHMGQCGDDKGIVGPPASYPPITVGQDGSGTAEVTLPMSTPNQGQYMVDVHHSAEQTGMIVSCGNLTTSAR